MRKTTITRGPVPPEDRFPRFAISLAAALAVTLLAIHRLDNPDVFFHIALGRGLWEGDWPPRLGELYFTPVTARWLGELRQSFLGDLTFALADRVGGLLLVQTLGLALLAAGGAILFRHARAGLAAAGSAAWHIQLSLGGLFFVLGTLQLQIVRNAAFSLVFFPAAVILARGVFCERRLGWIPLLVALFAWWSGFHGSYLLGLVVLTAMGVGALMDGARLDGGRPFVRRLGVVASTLCCVAGVVSIANPAAETYLSMPMRNLSSVLHPREPAEKPAPRLETVSPAVSAPPAFGSPTAAPEPTGLLAWLAAPLWKRSDQAPSSGDFLPAWRCWRYLPAMVALGGGLAVLGLVLFSRTPERWLLALPLGLSIYFGVCYVRGTGYVAILALWCLLRWKIALPPPSPDLRSDPGRAFQWAIAAGLGLIAALFLLAAAQGRLGLVLGDRARTFGFGTLPALDQKTCERVAQDRTLRRTFTTIWSGSFAEYCWDGKKRVFTDAFFPAHADVVWSLYRKTQRDRSLAPLVQRFGVDSALIENSRLDWQRLFWGDPEWAPVFLGTGLTCYARIPPGGSRPACEVLFDSADLLRLPNALARHNAAAMLLNLGILAGESERQGRSLLETDDRALAETAWRCLDPKIRAWTNRNGGRTGLFPLF